MMLRCDCVCGLAGYCFLLFQDELSVQALVEACTVDESKLYWCVSSPTMKDKPVRAYQLFTAVLWDTEGVYLPYQYNNNTYTNSKNGRLPERRQESCAIAKMTVQCALYTGALIIFCSSSSPSLDSWPLYDPNLNRNCIPKLKLDVYMWHTCRPKVDYKASGMLAVTLYSHFVKKVKQRQFI